MIPFAPQRLARPWIAGLALAAPLFVVTPAALAAQGSADGRSGLRPLLPEAVEIALARSAAPESVSSGATIFVLRDSGFAVAVEGTNGAACYVGRSWVESLEPHCFDPEGARTLVPLQLRVGEMRHRGSTQAEIDRMVERGLEDGTLRLPQRPVVSYMMSEGQRLISPDGTPVGNWKPHLMIYYPRLSPADIGYATPTDHPDIVLVDAGEPLANLMVVVPDFIAVEMPEGR